MKHMPKENTSEQETLAERVLKLCSPEELAKIQPLSEDMLSAAIEEGRRAAALLEQAHTPVYRVKEISYF